MAALLLSQAYLIREIQAKFAFTSILNSGNSSQVCIDKLMPTIEFRLKNSKCVDQRRSSSVERCRWWDIGVILLFYLETIKENPGEYSFDFYLHSIFFPKDCRTRFFGYYLKIFIFVFFDRWKKNNRFGSKIKLQATAQLPPRNCRILFW